MEMYSEITKTAKIYLRVPVWEDKTDFRIRVLLNVKPKEVLVSFYFGKLTWTAKSLELER